MAPHCPRSALSFGKRFIDQFFKQRNQITGVLPEVVPHERQIRSGFDELNDVHQVFSPLRYEFHVNERLDRDDCQAFAHRRVVENLFHLRTERCWRQVIYTYSVHFDGDAGFEGHQRSLMIERLFAH